MSKQNINKNSDQLARLGAVTRQTRETEILVEVNLDGTGIYDIGIFNAAQ